MPAGIAEAVLRLQAILREGYGFRDCQAYGVAASEAMVRGYDELKLELDQARVPPCERLLVHGTSIGGAEGISLTGLRRAEATSGKKLMYGEGAYLADFQGLGKACLFGTLDMSSESEVRTGKARRRGALVLFKAMLGKHHFVKTLLPKGKWYNAQSPMLKGEHSIIGTASAGYRGATRLENMVEYVLGDPQRQAVPVAFITFRTGRFGPGAWTQPFRPEEADEEEEEEEDSDE